MFIEKRMQEINDALGPVLKALGLECRVRPVGAALRVTFESPDEERWRSAVEIRFAAKEFSKHSEASWEECRVVLNEATLVPVGTTGWKCHEIIEEWETWTPDSGEHAIEVVSDMIECAALYPVGTNVAGVPNFSNFGDIWYQLVRDLDRAFAIDETDLELHRSDDGDDIVSFEYGGSNFEIVFLVPSYQALLCVDGEAKARSAAYRTSQVIDLVKTFMLMEFDPKF
ncbi:hypothetical protein IB270_34670 [Ensifer sp. ENS05]|uniref:hypothetical protein n=1 Tax=Ensifer sp. ENS05 TaxID=2769277 RepID=UPI00177BC4A5|nr:hypothetical protein [Ensifer sp. ENS05]MBD9597971.1 hypothetical protein [Ensifer sp. ENS05]